jgi:serine/threonine protein kinase
LAAALRDRYVLDRELGRGGMATVYLARDLRHDRLVALKVLNDELAVALGPERFLQEIRTGLGDCLPRRSSRVPDLPGHGADDLIAKRLTSGGGTARAVTYCAITA